MGNIRCCMWSLLCCIKIVKTIIKRQGSNFSGTFRNHGKVKAHLMRPSVANIIARTEVTAFIYVLSMLRCPYRICVRAIDYIFNDHSGNDTESCIRNQISRSHDRRPYSTPKVLGFQNSCDDISGATRSSVKLFKWNGTCIGAVDFKILNVIAFGAHSA